MHRAGVAAGDRGDAVPAAEMAATPKLQAATPDIAVFGMPVKA